MVNAEKNRSMGNTRIRRLLSESSFVAKLSTFIAAPEWCSPEGRRSQYRDMEGSLRPRLGLISWKQVCLMRMQIFINMFDFFSPLIGKKRAKKWTSLGLDRKILSEKIKWARGPEGENLEFLR